jgi:hypothetical protein
MGDASLIGNYRKFLTTVQARASALKKEGKSLDETIKTIQTELQATYSPPNRMVSAIRAAYNEAP